MLGLAPKAAVGVTVVAFDATLVALVAQGQGQPVLGSWGQAGVFVAGLSAGAAAVVWTLRTLRELRQPPGTGSVSDADLQQERRIAAAVRLVTDDLARTRHELRERLGEVADDVGRLELRLAEEFRVLERRLLERGQPR